MNDVMHVVIQLFHDNVCMHKAAKNLYRALLHTRYDRAKHAVIHLIVNVLTSQQSPWPQTLANLLKAWPKFALQFACTETLLLIRPSLCKLNTHAYITAFGSCCQQDALCSPVMKQHQAPQQRRSVHSAHLR